MKENGMTEITDRIDSFLDEDCAEDPVDGRMKRALGMDDMNQTVADGYDGGPQAAAEDLVDEVGWRAAQAMCNCSYGSTGNDFLGRMKDAVNDMGPGG